MAKSGNTPQDIRLSVRLTPEERLELEKRADGQRLSDYVRRSLLGRQSRQRHASLNQRDLAQILALLGQSDAFSSLKSLADAADNGSFAADEQCAADIRAAREELSQIKSLLMRALRTKER